MTDYNYTTILYDPLNDSWRAIEVASDSCYIVAPWGELVAHAKSFDTALDLADAKQTNQEMIERICQACSMLEDWLVSARSAGWAPGTEATCHRARAILDVLESTGARVPIVGEVRAGAGARAADTSTDVRDS